MLCLVHNDEEISYTPATFRRLVSLREIRELLITASTEPQTTITVLQTLNDEQYFGESGFNLVLNDALDAVQQK